MSNAPVKKVSPRDIQTVQNLIERCLQLYMNQREVVETLMVQAKIEPGFTELVWQKLEEENREFFKAYYLRLMVKQQINEFNKLLEQQVRLMHQVNQSSVASMPISNGPPSVASLPLTNGSHMTPLHLNSAFYTPEQTGTAIKAETSMHQSIGSCLGGAFTGDNAALHQCMHPTVELPTQPSRDDTVSNLVTMQNSNVGMIHGLNGGTIKSEACYSGTPPYIFGGADGSVLDARQSVVDASVASFSSAESNSQALNESFIDDESHSYGFLSSIPRNFSLTDLSADFTQSSDILENYPRSPFLAAEPDNFLDCHEREPQDHKRLDTISESMSFDDFGSE